MRQKRKKESRPASLKLPLVAVATVVLIALCYLGIVSNGVSGWTIPEWVQWNDRELAADIDGDGDFETLSLSGRQVSVYDDGNFVCSLPENWLTSDAYVYDIDGDGRQEVITLTWKRGSFGYAHPFWIDEDTKELTQHVFIFNYDNDRFNHRWLSSDVRIDIASMDIDSLGRLHLSDPDGGEEVCEWQDWGLTYLNENASSVREMAFDSATLLFAGDSIVHEGMLREAREEAQAELEAEETAQESEGASSGPAAGALGAFREMYSGIKGHSSSADLAIINQEAPLVRDIDDASGKFPVFRAPVESAQALADSGFNVFALANNHIADAGVDGIRDTVELLEGEEVGVDVIGVDISAGEKSNTFEVNGISVGIANCTYGLNAYGDGEVADSDEGADVSVGASANGSVGASAGEGSSGASANEGVRGGSSDLLGMVNMIGDSNALLDEVRRLDQATDFTVCYLHVGEEYSDTPTEEVRSLVEDVVSAGADLVVCAHAHVVQEAEIVEVEGGRSAYVCYGLGNLISNSPYPDTVLGAMLEVVIDKPKDDGEEPIVFLGKPRSKAALAEKGDDKRNAAEDSSTSTAEADASTTSEGKVRIMSCNLIPTVCHYADGKTQVMLLEDYDEQLAKGHFLNSQEPGSVSMESLLSQWRSSMH